jgi:hypothetical protein
MEVVMPRKTKRQLEEELEESRRRYERARLAYAALLIQYREDMRKPKFRLDTRRIQALEEKI